MIKLQYRLPHSPTQSNANSSDYPPPNTPSPQKRRKKQLEKWNVLLNIISYVVNLAISNTLLVKSN